MQMKQAKQCFEALVLFLISQTATLGTNDTGNKELSFILNHTVSRTWTSRGFFEIERRGCNKYDTFLVYDKLSANADNAIIFNSAHLYPFHISLFLLPRFFTINWSEISGFTSARNRRAAPKLDAFGYDINNCLFIHWTPFKVVEKGNAVLQNQVVCGGKQLCYGTAPNLGDPPEQKEFHKAQFAVCYNTTTRIPTFTGHVVKPGVVGGNHEPDEFHADAYFTGKWFN